MQKKQQTSVAARVDDVLLSANSRQRTRPIWIVREAHRRADTSALEPGQKAWLKNSGWLAVPGQHCVMPDGDGGISGVVVGVSDATSETDQAFTAGEISAQLPAGDYHFATHPGANWLAPLAWVLAAYRFEHYKSETGAAPARLKLSKSDDEAAIRSLAEAVYLGRDLINIPANDMGPDELEAAARALASAHGSKLAVTRGKALLENNYPLIHAVGRASDRAPRLLDFSWTGNKKGPAVTLVGKGICFDTGGLNIKPGNSMLLMKKDMGGAAAVLSLASMIMSAKLPVRLRVLIPAAENSISANAYRPGDVLDSRLGTTVEIGNTDAEGRLVLADALALADEDKPDYLFSFATLTGAARVALGPDLPPLYSTDDDLADRLTATSMAVGDPLWRMPFWERYDSMLTGQTADISHISPGGFAGSITAALFLKRFVRNAKRYVHLDIYGWVPSRLPGRPKGGEPNAARAVFETLSAIVLKKS